MDPIKRKGPPRWGAPVAKDKVKVNKGPLPANVVAATTEIKNITDIINAANAGAGKRAPVKKPIIPVVHKNVLETANLNVPLPKSLEDFAARILGTNVSHVKIHPTNDVTKQKDVFVPPNRRFFKEFVIQSYWRYKLADVPEIPDPDACAKAAEASKKEVKTFAYQSFVRDYMQKPSPYRGVLVYHGLGSGKTCTSIAALEALYQEHQRPIIIMTPASLQPNYRDEITKCGPYIYRIQNHWTWISVPDLTKPSPEGEMLLKVIGIPKKSILKRGGAWLPDPEKPPNYEELTTIQRTEIREQIIELMDHRFQFINYNGVPTETVRMWACEEGKKKFDGATIIIDEVHNLIRTINNSALEAFYKDEPRNMAEFNPKYCNVAAKKYNKSYLLYRMLCDAVGAKIIALSATPIINFAQEVAILANLLAGDGRMAEITVPVVTEDKTNLIKDVLKFHPEVDFYEIVTRGDGSGTNLIRMTAVPSGFRKVVNPSTGEFRGFIRDARSGVSDAEINRERHLTDWYQRVVSELYKLGIPPMRDINMVSFQRLPDLEQPFHDIFIDPERFIVKDSTKLLMMARLSGLISYYKGGKKDLMASSTEYIVPVDMSEQQLKEYTTIRFEELKKEQMSDKRKNKAVVKKESLFDQMNKTISSTFKIFSRAACNFAFPNEIPRPRPSDFREMMKMIGARPGTAAADADAVADEADTSTIDPDGVLFEPVKPVEEDEPAAGAGAGAASNANNSAAIAKKLAIMGAPDYETAITDVLSKIRASAKDLFSVGKLKTYSPKFQAIIDRIKPSIGPVLVYSNFKTLEGVGLFSIALEVQLGLRKLDIIQSGGGWSLAPEMLVGDAANKQYYISYTGDEDREKRNILLAIFNSKWSKVPGSLAEQIQKLTGAADNKSGKICKIFMITQSGAEGISLSNVRQVHIMEPYWNYVRLDQVKGRAIRICSHMDLPPEERHVDTYIYISRFSEEQKIGRRVDQTLINFDEGLTTDETIWKLMNSKKKMADSILDVMRAAAVDCELNTTENGGYACYRFDKATMEPLFHPNINVDISESAAYVRGRR